MTNIGKVIWLFSALCHFSCWSTTSQDCTWASELTFQDVKDAIDKLKQLDILNTRIANLEQQVATLQTYVPSIIFHAKVSDGKNPIGPGHIVYDTVIVNKGSGYNPSTGIFTAPVAGIYYFTYSLLGLSNSGNTEVHLMKNREALSYIHSILSASQAQAASMPAILTLNKNDQVWVSLIQGGAWSGRGALNFQGVLLEAK
ncbi:complement C1q-like protein 3 isoform X2 [Stegostoma tigrinum]|uniref:complement C1q-like protein 3 isoform X1 n=1 Tax=Stegostoma tigrinum TaxID=3053191 RepID=UPI00202B698F|nr:complement C1q-like protein 3 isoform X1 [Stegostoma tigrinum]XP_048409330.1 complement C1q-like protein 3 isoform X2 [Stegostoma tigrinum]